MKKTLGGQRLGSGKKMQVDLHGYGRSTHNMGYIWRSTMASGTLVPFLCEVGLPGDTFDIDLDSIIMTHPTIGPLLGSYKAQYDIFSADVRLYQGQLHNNKLGVGLRMKDIKLPQMRLEAVPLEAKTPDVDNAQINPSCILSYLNIRGVGNVEINDLEREFNAIPLLMYWDIYKNYYSNKQEEIGYVIHGQPVARTITTFTNDTTGTPIQEYPTNGYTTIDNSPNMEINWLVQSPAVDTLYLNTDKGRILVADAAQNVVVGAGTTTFTWNTAITGNLVAYNFEYSAGDVNPRPVEFQLSTIDTMRETILSETLITSAFVLNDNIGGSSPYGLLLLNGPASYVNTQEGLGLKTYQSDLFNNWLSTEWIDGVGGISDLSAVDVTSGKLRMDALNISKKVYDMLNRVAVSGGSYDDWQDANWMVDRYGRAESPVYHGGLIKELIFQQVVSNSEANGDGGNQPLGTLGGRGVMAKKHKGGKIVVKPKEPCYIMGICSLTPRLDYSQGNKWDTQLKTMDDFHKPALDEIGFQELITEQMAWFTTGWDAGTGTWKTKSAGKQPAWINYMTNVNQVRGNFAIQTNEMFMTLNRRYEWDGTIGEFGDILDLTTYVDPKKFNYIFAETSYDAQNFWVQIGIDMQVRRIMSAKLMPNV